MRIQIVSDLHLERGLLPFDTLIDTGAHADVLVLAGDIGCPRTDEYWALLRWCRRYYKDIILICGNHEYRSCMPWTFKDVDMHIVANIANMDKNGGTISFLQQGQNKIIGNLNFVGATLWTRIPNEVIPQHVTAINDSFAGMIIAPGIPLSVASMSTLFQQHLAGIECSLQQGIQQQLKNIVVTHHAPILKTMYKVEDYPKNYLYGTDLEQYLKYDVVHTWIYGHSHWNMIHNVRGTMLVTNQHGGHDVPCRGWSTSFLITV